MPAGETRDSFGTNNITESMFRVFVNVVLGSVSIAHSLTRPFLVLNQTKSPRNTCNGRLDLLVVSILDAMLPYYRDLIMSATDDPRVSQQFRQILADGNMLYDRDLVTSISLDPPRFAVGSLQATESDVFAAPDIPNCTCSSFHKNGRLCPHLVAASLHSHNGGPATIINLKSKSKPPTTSVPDSNSAPPIRSALVRNAPPPRASVAAFLDAFSQLNPLSPDDFEPFLLGVETKDPRDGDEGSDEESDDSGMEGGRGDDEEMRDREHDNFDAALSDVESFLDLEAVLRGRPQKVAALHPHRSKKQLAVKLPAGKSVSRIVKSRSSAVGKVRVHSVTFSLKHVDDG